MHMACILIGNSVEAHYNQQFSSINNVMSHSINPPTKFHSYCLYITILKD